MKQTVIIMNSLPVGSRKRYKLLLREGGGV